MNSFNSFTIIWNIKIFIHLYKCTAEDKRQNTQNTGNQNIIKKTIPDYLNIPLPACLLDGYSGYFDIYSLFPIFFFVVTVLIVRELRRIPNERSYIFNNTSNIISTYSRVMGLIVNYMLRSLISWSDYSISSSHFKRAKKLMLFTSCI